MIIGDDAVAGEVMFGHENRIEAQCFDENTLLDGVEQALLLRGSLGPLSRLKKPELHAKRLCSRLPSYSQHPVGCRKPHNPADSGANAGVSRDKKRGQMKRSEFFL